MPILQCLTDSFKQESWQAIHNLPVDTLRLALYTGNADLGPQTTVYGATNEVVGAGYTAGGVVLTGVTLALASNVAFVTFANPSWTGTSFICRGALIYNASKANRAVAVLDFGADRRASGPFTVVLPPAGPTTAIIRFQ